MDDAPDVEEGESFALLDRILVMSKPLSKHVYSTTSSLSEKGPIFYGNDTFYVLFRLHRVFPFTNFLMYSSLTRNNWFCTH